MREDSTGHGLPVDTLNSRIACTKVVQLTSSYESQTVVTEDCPPVRQP